MPARTAIAVRARALRIAAGAAVTAVVLGGAGGSSAWAVPSHGTGPTSGSCRLADGIRHVVQIQFDNVHLTRDDPDVPSDLEQMPTLLGFLEHNGTVLANTHDVLVHTATNFLADQTGLYPDRMSITQSNSGSFFDAAGTPRFAPAFGYWTDPLTTAGGDQKYLMDYAADRDAVPTTANVDAPAPWVPFTRGGCDVGEIGIANTVLENTGTDVTTVFGAGSPQATEAAADPAKAAADFEGLAVHCAQGSAVCAQGKPDVLPDEPGGYAGYQALFGNAEIRPAVSPSGPVRNLDGAAIGDGKGNDGFPGFDSLTPTNSLGYAAQLLEHGVEVTNVYVSDAHGDHSPAHTGDFGPGEQGYERQLADYDRAFATFLARLAHDGITPANTLFSVTTDEGDHFSGSAATPAGCTGLNGNYCHYTTRSEVDVNLPGLLATQRGNTTPFAIHSDPAPALWVNGDPDRTSATVRQLGQDIAGLSFANPLTGRTEPVAYQLADRVEEKILHFVGPDGARTPTLTAFSGEDTYVTGGPGNCASPCVSTSQGFAWNHGGLWPDMQTIWSAYVGPGVRPRGVDLSTWADQTDARPTVLALTGLHDDYLVDGRVLVEVLAPSALPASLTAHAQSVRRLGELYKQILAADGRFAYDTLAASTHAVSSWNDGRYTDLENRLAALGHQRNQIADEIRGQLLGAAFDGRPVDERAAQALERQAQQLLDSARRLATA
jgi:hypothetical protein